MREPIGPIIKGHVTLQDGTSRLSCNISNKLPIKDV